MELPIIPCKPLKNVGQGFKELLSSLQAIDTTNWSVENQGDWMIVWAEMNGYDFNHRILKPWVRNPAFYKALCA